MGKHNKPASDAEKPKLLKPIHAAKLVDKNARTIAKMMQLLVCSYASCFPTIIIIFLIIHVSFHVLTFLKDATQRATSSAIDNETHTAQRLEKLTNRLNRRLTRLARWSDNPVFERETPDMRATYGRHQPGNYAIKSSYGGYVPMSAPPQPSYHAQQQYHMAPAPGIMHSSSSQVAAGVSQQSNVAKAGDEEDDDDEDDDDDDDEGGEGGMEGKEGGPIEQGAENMEGDDDDDDDDDDEEEEAVGQESQDTNDGQQQIQTAADDDDGDGDDDEYNEAREGDGNDATHMDVVPNQE